MILLNGINFDNIEFNALYYSNKYHYLCTAKSIISQLRMKYSELERKLRKIGCYDTKKQMAGHPIWYSPVTGKEFKMSNHGGEEVASGTLRSIRKMSGLA